ncbi:virulence protein SciE type [Chromatiales bacterium (ex Bugula neritina AB1)]|nr:virulence protein SciE type [Chromatiales bacterium (ex Bugula neritina AB1)]
MSQAARDKLKSGDLSGALTDLKSHIRDNPAEPKSRIFLFQLLAVTGDWSKALTQLNVAAELDSSATLMAQTCRELINCEDFRSSVFQGERAPLIFGKPEPWVATLIQALGPAVRGDGEMASRAATAAFSDAETIGGTIDGEPFTWIADGDMRLGPATEIVVNGKYYWIPFSSISEIKLYAPEDLRDLVWIPAEFKWKNEGESVGFIPVRYPGHFDDDQLSLARKTTWNDIGNEYFIGAGQRIISTDSADYPLLQIRHIVIDQPVDEVQS